MKLSPFMKQVEIEGGYKGFYRVGKQKVSVTVEENGIAVYADSRSGVPLETGTLVRLFKPMTSLWEGKKFAETLDGQGVSELVALGFIKLSSVEA